jgi:serine/threonine protein phosphatase PrpC
MGNASVAPQRRPVTSKWTERDECAAQKLKFAVSGMKGWRPTMEDQHLFSSRLSIAQKITLQDHSIFAVFDGHGGGVTSKYLKDTFLSVFCKRPEMEEYADLSKSGPKSRSDSNGVQLLKDALSATFLEIDTDLMTLHNEQVERGKSAARANNETISSSNTDSSAKKPTPLSQFDRSGSTAVVVLLTPTHIVCANAGDSRAILRRYGCVLPLSFDHKPSNIVERRRIKDAGGFVKKKRVDGDLAVSRAFGDFCMKSNISLHPSQQKVIVDPDFLVYPRDLAGDEFIILACDGVWDVATNETCSDFVQNLLSEGEIDLGSICEEALDTCLERRSRDNMTMMLVGLPALKADMSSKARLNNALWGHRTTRQCKNLTNLTVGAVEAARAVIETQVSNLGVSKPTLFAF